MQSVQELIEVALKEDIGSGDITTESLVDPDQCGSGRIIAKEDLVLAGIEIAKQVFTTLDPDITFHHDTKDGQKLKKGDVILGVEGKLSCLLTGERTALNFLQHLSGIASCVRTYMDELKYPQVHLVDTRKTLPGFRVLEKYAVRVGGGQNHRMGLYDGVLIKDNHLAVCSSMQAAVEKIRNRISHLIKIEVEVSNLSEVKAALAAKVDVIMLDNMDVDQIKEAVSFIDGKAIVEVSGNITENNLNLMASTGVDIISIGALTHSARSVDISMDIEIGAKRKEKREKRKQKIGKRK